MFSTQVFDQYVLHSYRTACVCAITNRLLCLNSQLCVPNLVLDVTLPLWITMVLSIVKNVKMNQRYSHFLVPLRKFCLIILQKYDFINQSNWFVISFFHDIKILSVLCLFLFYLIWPKLLCSYTTYTTHMERKNYYTF